MLCREPNYEKIIAGYRRTRFALVYVSGCLCIVKCKVNRKDC